MKVLQIKTLAGVPVEQIHKAFTDAFSEYKVPLEMPLEKLVEMMTIRDLNPEYSVGCFAGDTLVGFILCGFREINGEYLCYDGGTGVIKAYQRKGIGEMMLKDLLQFLKEKQVKHFVLEVLENNTPAINLYEKYGFKKTRRLECFEIERLLVPELLESEANVVIQCPVKEIPSEKSLKLYVPTWQNENKSVLNVKGKYTQVSFLKNGELMCYAFIHKTKGDIPQIGLKKQGKNRDLVSTMVSELARQTESDKIIVLNVEENNILGEILRNLGFRNFVNQWEMDLTL